MNCKYSTDTMQHPVTYIESYNTASYNKAIALFYRKLPRLKTSNLAERVDQISQAFIGRAYILGANGEGHEGQFDQAPLYRFDGFDCVTYINTVLALALSFDVVSFRRNLLKIAYNNSQLAYRFRHHFMSVDWNVHNQQMGLVKDVTEELAESLSDISIKYADTTIDRPNWFRHRGYQDIRLVHKLSDEQEEELLQLMHGISETVTVEKTHFPYIAIRDLFDKKLNPNSEVFQRIPSGSLVEIVRPNWDVFEKIGTNLNVSHVGFVIQKAGKTLYRQASMIEKCVCDIPLDIYLKQRLESPTVKGINIQQLVF